MRHFIFQGTSVAILLAYVLVHTTAQLSTAAEFDAFNIEQTNLAVRGITRRKRDSTFGPVIISKIRGGASLHSNLAASWLDTQQAALSNARHNVRATANSWPKTVNGLTAAAFFAWGDLVAQAHTRALKANEAVDSVAVPSSSTDRHTQSNAAAGQRTPKSKGTRLGLQLDWAHAFRYGLVGFGSGVIWGGWYRYLDIFLAKLWNSSSIPSWFASSRVAESARVLISVFLEQFVGSPIVFGLYLIPALTVVMPGHQGPMPNATTIVTRVKQQLGGLLWLNAKVWTVANMLVYSLPLQWRLVVCNALGTLWAVLQADFVNNNDHNGKNHRVGSNNDASRDRQSAPPPSRSP